MKAEENFPSYSLFSLLFLLVSNSSRQWENVLLFAEEKEENVIR